MLIKGQVTVGQVRSAIAKHGPAIVFNDLSDVDVLRLAEVDVAEEEAEAGFSAADLRRIGGEHCDRDHSAEDYDEDDKREALDPRVLGDFVQAVAVGDRVGAGALATRLFMDAELEGVEAALRRMKVAA